MNFVKKDALRLGLTAAVAALIVLPTQAQIHSKNRELVVESPSKLSEQAQSTGNALFLHSDDAGSTFLYEEQADGKRLVVFDVTDPAHIKVASTQPLEDHGAFDFVRPLDGRAELVRFRQGGGVGVLDLRKGKTPTLHLVNALINPGQSQPLGESGYLGIDEPYNYVRAVPRDYQVVDISVPSEPSLLTTVKAVKHQVTNSDTGTIFLLGSEGLTVVRRISVEEDYKIHQMQMQGN
ncbi:MAG: hypothetical protein NVS9B15_07190 [Acidobacteriaceae bacterium]